MSVIDFNSGYLVPGVYVQPVTTPTPQVSNLASDVIALVGPANGYLTFTDGLALSQSAAVPLTQLGISESSVQVTNSSGVVQAGSNYTLVQTGSAPNTVTTIELTSGSTMTAGVVYYITYNYTNANYYTPQAFTNYQALQAVYGNPFGTNGGIASPISLAAIFAFNGASTVVVMPTTDTGGVATRAGIQAAYSALTAINGVDLIVPLPVGMTGTQSSPGDILNLAADLSSHCQAMSQPSVGYYRTGLIGYETTETVNPDYIAAQTNNQRVTEVWPNQLAYYNPIVGQSLNIGGYYLAAACAGVLAGNPRNQGLTRQTIQGFNGIPNTLFLTMTQAYLNQLSAAGVCVLAPSPGTGALIIRDGCTTNVSNALTREISLVRCSDAMLSILQQSLNGSALIGTPINTNTATIIQSLVEGCLAYLVSEAVIAGYTALAVQVASGSPQVMNVTFGYAPSYPLRYINVSFSVSTLTGTLSPITTSGTTSTTSGSTLSSS